MPTRHRTQGGLLPISTSWVWSANNGSSPENNSATAQARSGTVREMNDVVTPSFRLLRAKGEIINTPMDWYSDTFSGGDTGWRIRRYLGQDQYGVDIYSTGDCGGNWNIVQYGIPLHLDVGLTDIKSEAITAARAGISSPEVQGLVSAIELKKTLKMLANPMKGLREYIFSRKSHRKGSPPLWEVARDSWLEYRYGWRPFMMEADAILQSLGKEYSKRQTSRATRADTGNATSTWTASSGGLNMTFETTTTRTLKVRAGVLYEHRGSFDQTYGLRLSDIPSAAWELVPYSFVVDWFVNVGDFIESITPKAGVLHLAEFVTVSETLDTDRRAVNVALAGFEVMRNTSGSDRRITKSFARIPSLPQPSLSVSLGPLRTLFDDQRELDALALLTQIFKTGSKQRRFT